MDKITYDIAMAEAENHFSNRADKLEMQELLFICKTEPNTPILDAVVRAKQIVKNSLEQELKAIKESEVQDA
tara:strand:+ start:938 stop:1153 length:216 start_codon:yes stop_codon:yes gene_type:complete